MGKTIFTDGDPFAGIAPTTVDASFLNMIFSHRHDGLAQDGSAPVDYAADTGAANAYAIAPSPALTQYITGMLIVFSAANTNTGASTVNINALGAKPIKRRTGDDLLAGDIEAGQLVVVAYDGVNFQILSPVNKGQLKYISLTASGNFTTPANISAATMFKITLIGGGGGAGAASAVSSVSQAGGAGGGVTFYVSGLSPNTAYAVVIGAGGAGGAQSAPNNGGGGGTTQITINGTVYSATGGFGGAGTASAAINGTAPQGGTSPGGIQIFQTTSVVGVALSGSLGFASCGASLPPYGGGGGGGYSGNGSGGTGIGYGSGGGGAVGVGGGGNGAPGIVIIEWVG
ncbi:MAG: hypothetical protein M0Z48_00680 [Nitrospiraceae bacterium]|nr:hypothetical protein [Nitrospiraceae bacterium]